MIKEFIPALVLFVITLVFWLGARGERELAEKDRGQTVSDRVIFRNSHYEWKMLVCWALTTVALSGGLIVTVNEEGAAWVIGGVGGLLAVACSTLAYASNCEEVVYHKKRMLRVRRWWGSRNFSVSRISRITFDGGGGWDMHNQVAWLRIEDRDGASVKLYGGLVGFPALADRLREDCAEVCWDQNLQSS